MQLSSKLWLRFILSQMVACVFFMEPLFAFGPLTNGGHMILEELSGVLRLTLQIHRDFLPESLDEQLSSQILAEQVFAATLRDYPIKFSDGRSCSWRRPGLVRSKTALTLQIQALCPDSVQRLNWELGFVKNWPEYFTLYVEGHFQSGAETFVITPSSPILLLKDTKAADAILAGFAFVGLSPSAWFEPWGALRFPKGLRLILVFLVCLMASKQLADFVIYITLVILLHGLSPFLIKHLNLNLAKTTIELAWLSGVASIALLLFVFKKRSWVVYSALTALGLLSGLSFLLEKTLTHSAIEGFYFNLGSGFVYLLAGFAFLPWFVLILRSGWSLTMLSWLLLGLTEGSVLCLWLFS